MPQNIANEEVNPGEIIYSWEVSEYERPERNRRWYILMGILAAVLIIYAVIAANYLFALLIALFGIILFMHDIIEPQSVPFAIAQTGILLGSKFYKFGELENFWMIYEPPIVKNLYFKVGGLIKHRLTIPLLDNDPRPIRDYLNTYLEEDLDEEEEPASDKIGRIFRL